MSQFQPTYDASQLRFSLNWVFWPFHNWPLICTLSISIIVTLGYIFRRFLLPSAYPNIDGPPCKNVFSGHIFDIFSPHNISFHDTLQDTYGSVTKVKGKFGKEDLYVSDPRFLHEVLVKEVHTVFRHPQGFYEIMAATFGLGLLATTGELHKAQRKLKDAITRDIGGAERKEIDMLHWCSKVALELIGQAGLGHSFGVLEGIESEYSHAVKSFNPALAAVMPFLPLFSLIYRSVPTPVQHKLAGWAPITSVRKLKEIVEIQDRQAQSILTQKREMLDKGSSDDMQDIMSVLLKANLEADEKDRLPEDQLLGQMNLLIEAGHETTSGALARILQILSSNLSLQDRLRAELERAPTGQSYDELNALPFLDALCRETLRLYAPVPFTERETLRDWVVPLRYPLKGTDGKLITDIYVKKGTSIYVGLREANRCKETWGEDADEFKPDRWLDDLPSSVHGAKTSGVYSSMMTFSAGPRACIGFKFSLLELKIVLSTLIKSFKFTQGSAQVKWLSCVTMVPYPEKTMDCIADGQQPQLPLQVSVLS
ncbi:Putative cytochrome P450 cyp-13B1 [Caenorhabditis elegans] [Rhizoctonia solani]|uniref:Putative cytochrome P450 cyp-13B1 [Caenorhabditis elegans] n=1 Tax=Rhizoctonia solani TaxID=456999 RepID=A0A0K6G7F2_9AGAM|nr:Putative cytochrome P450 cyp-13B1 [Caenorhabditis elegans] [Rhizoctonia solani]